MTGTTGRTPPVRNAQCAISIGASVQFHFGTDSYLDIVKNADERLRCTHLVGVLAQHLKRGQYGVDVARQAEHLLIA